MAYDFNSLTKQADEANNRDKFYTDFSDVDPNKLHQITELTDWMRTKAKGSDVREIIAQLFERTWLENIKEGNANMEVAQARGTHPNLRSRLDESDKKQRENTAQLAQKANKDEVTNVITPKGTLAYASLPTSGNQVGWYYYCPDGDGTHGAGNYVWNGTSWYFGGTGDEGYNLLKSDLGNYLSKFVSFEIKEKVYIDGGTEKADNGWSATDYICIDDVGNDFVITYVDTTNFNTNYYSTIYDENKNPIKNINMHIDGDVVNFGTNGKYVRFSNVTNVIKSMKIQSINLKAINFVIDNQEPIAEIPNIKNDIEEVKGTLNNLVPSYYVEHIKEKETIIRGHESDCGFNGDSFVFLTDTHHSVDYAIENDKTSNDHNSNNSVSLIRDILKNTATRMVIFGGDLIHTSNGIDEMLNGISSYVSRINEFNFHYCVGNHEYFTDYPTQATIPSYKQLYASSSKKDENDILGVGEGFSYYFDNPVQKVRYFVISCDSVTWLSINQTEWVLKQFENIPSGYKLVCIGHAFMSDDMTSFRNRYKIIADALDAIKNKTTYDFVATEYTTYHHDYSSTDITPICMITGHTHVDGSITTPSGIPCICTTCDSYSQNYEYVDGTLTNVPREIGTVNEQAFDVIQFDFDNRKIYCTRIGAGSDREFSY